MIGIKTWTDERVEILKDLWIKGESASQIAMKLGGPAVGITRNAVISKVHRMKLPQRNTTTRNIGRRTGRKKTTPYRFGAPVAANSNIPVPTIEPEPYTSAFVEIDVPLDQRKGLLDLEKDDCRWPIGDPRTPEFHFCNGKHIPGQSYCLHHTRAAKLPVDSRAASRRPEQVRVAVPIRETEDA